MPEWIKQDIVALTGLSRDALHIHIGLALMLAFAALLKGRRLLVAWGSVFALELVNEAIELSADLLHPWTGDWVDSLYDIANTMLWPSLLMLIVLRLPGGAARMNPWPASRSMRIVAGSGMNQQRA